MKSALAALALSCLAACGSAGTFAGSIGGTGLSVGDAVFVTANAGLGSTAQALYVVLANTPDICAQIRSTVDSPGETFLVLEMTRVGQSSDDLSVTPGTYTIKAPASTTSTVLAATAVFQVLGADCKETKRAEGNSGTVTLSTFTDGSRGSATGSFKLQLGDRNEAASGKFTAHPCAEMATRFNSPPSQITCR